MNASEMRLLDKRITFEYRGEPAEHSYNFPVMVVVFRPRPFYQSQAHVHVVHYEPKAKPNPPPTCPSCGYDYACEECGDLHHQLTQAREAIRELAGWAPGPDLAIWDHPAIKAAMKEGGG